LIEVGEDALLEGFELVEDDGGLGIGGLLVLGLFVAVQGEVVVLGLDLGFGDEE
jgi:hypothetical protein